MLHNAFNRQTAVSFIKAVCFALPEPSDDLNDLNFFNQKKKKKKPKKVFDNDVEEGLKVSHSLNHHQFFLPSHQ